MSARLRILRVSARPRLSRGRTAQTSAKKDGLEGTRVRVLEGPFAGKTGVVQELDGRGSARVLFGQLSAYVEVVALAPETRKARGGLRSSHRRSRLDR